VELDETEQYWEEVRSRATHYLDKRIEIRGNNVWPGEHNYLVDQLTHTLKDHKVQSVLDVGCGYGRDSLYFAKQGFEVTAIDLSRLGLSIGREKALLLGCNIHFIEEDFLSCNFKGQVFDCIYLYKFLHQVRPCHLSAFMNKLLTVLSPLGVLALATFAISDPGYGRGMNIEKDVYDERGFRPVHYFSWLKLRDLLRSFRIIWRELVTTPEQSYEGDPLRCYEHKLWYLVAKLR